MKKGFTLFELLTTLVVIGLVYIIIFPASLEIIRRSSLRIDQATQSIIYAQTKLYLNDNPHQYPKNEMNIYCLELQYLKEAGYLEGNLFDGFKRQNLDYDLVVKITFDEQFAFEVVDYRYCDENVESINYIDQSGANPPKLMGSMIPVIWNEGWITADLATDWYDYDQKRWANVVLVFPQNRQLYLDGGPDIMVTEADIMAHFVWIPRYRYKLFNSEAAYISERTIQVQFESTVVVKSISDITGQWLTHPAFTTNQDLSGFWVGKFSTTGNQYVPTIKPNKSMLLDQTTKNQYQSAMLIGINDYGLNGESRMMRNLEWGAVAYLSMSTYGLNSEVAINPNLNYLTGCAYLDINNISTIECETYESTYGIKASTTGNVYGVYDMSGGAWERVLGVMLDAMGNVVGLSSGFTDELSDEDFLLKLDKYEYDTLSNTFTRRILGDATGEVVAWYSDYAMMPHDDNKSWVIRGGNHTSTNTAGLFAFAADNGGSGARSFRIVVPAN